MEQQYLPGEIRERIKDLLKERNVSQAELADRIGCAESTLSRFLSGAVNKLSDESLIAIAKYFGVSTDFLLGLTDIPDRKNFDIEELGLSAGAAKALYTNKTTALVVNALLENKSFPELAQMIRHYAEGTLAAGYAAQNQMYSMLTAMLMGENAEAATEVKALRTPAYQADLTHIQTAFTKIVQQLREDNAAKIEAARAVTKEVMQKMFAELPKGEDLRTVTPEQIVDTMTATVRGIDGVTEEQLAEFQKGVLPLFQKTTGDIEDAGADE